METLNCLKCSGLWIPTFHSSSFWQNLPFGWNNVREDSRTQWKSTKNLRAKTCLPGTSIVDAKLYLNRPLESVTHARNLQATIGHVLLNRSKYKLTLATSNRVKETLSENVCDEGILLPEGCIAARVVVANKHKDATWETRIEKEVEKKRKRRRQRCSCSWNIDQLAFLSYLSCHLDHRNAKISTNLEGCGEVLVL